jgi:signal transduction histidine kinase
MNRLQVRLILAFTLVVLVAVGGIAVLILRTTDTQFRRYITHSDMQASGSGLDQLIAYYEANGSWKGVDILLNQGVFMGAVAVPPIPGVGPATRRIGGPLDVVLADTNYKIVYDSAGTAQGKKLKSAERSQAMPITGSDGQEVIGYLLLSFPSGPGPLGNLEQQFLDDMKQILIAGIALAVALGLIIGTVLSRSLTAPLRRLSLAARAVAGGELNHQVPVGGSTEMIEVARAFNEMTVALGKSEKQRQNMVADLAHELRTPLSIMQGNLRAILDDVYALDKAEISRVYDETLLLNRMVDDLRELALADAGQLRLELRLTRVEQIICSTVDNLALAAEAQEVALTTQLPDDLPTVRADPDRLAQVLRNLLLNALRHTRPGGEVQVAASSTNSSVEIAVADTGEGIGPEDLPHVFERFWRADPARAHSDGTGLGLSVAQSLVEAQGGQIWAESKLHEGSTFRFTLLVGEAPG